MSAEAVGGQMPAVITLDDLAAMNSADHYGHRYELSPEGALSIMPPPDLEHASIASRICFWFAMAGWSGELVLQAAGIRIPGRDGDGARIPDVTVWARPQLSGVWASIADLLLVVEVVSPGSRTTDEVIKRQEYASAGIPRYWMVERDSAQTVTMHVLGANGGYDMAAKMPLGWLLRSKPADHGLAT